MKQEELEYLNERLKDKSPVDIIKWAVGLGKSTVLTTNFRPYESAILFAGQKAKSDIKVVWCDSGYNTRETYLFAEKLIESLNLNLFTYVPKRTAAHRDVVLGIPEVNTPEHNVFSEEVKLEPFRRALEEHKPEVWITNLRQGQTVHRDNLDILSIDSKGVLKVAPFYYYSDTDLDAYLEENNLPNEHRYFDPTKALENRECGIHQ
ncbi:MAG: phosphoadenosine phosphosulfate reductase family protein [Crocinitomicaceae bacterium]|nr:phosphoadenosine phosphosulfate reductase family protein [Crocinitomicaceae bacterium]